MPRRQAVAARETAGADAEFESGPVTGQVATNGTGNYTAESDTDLGPHQAYAFQWWLGMVAGFVLVWFGARREYLEGLEQAAPAGTPVPRKKVRIWDEEDG